jgi:enoyl-CoA hydratase
MDYQEITLERDGAVATIALSRPEKLNAISRRMSAELIDCLDATESDDGVRVIVLTGAGDKAFCAGADMGQAALGHDAPAADGEMFAGGDRDWAARAAVRLARVRKPLIGAVNGYAYGGGAVFAITCDIRLCSDNAAFRFVGASYGLVVGASRLPAIVGPAMAKELIFTARTVDSAEALRIGLANHVVPLAELPGLAGEIAAQIAEHSPTALMASKEVIDLATLEGDAARREMEWNLELRQSEEHRERFRAAAERVVKRD